MTGKTGTAAIKWEGASTVRQRGTLMIFPVRAGSILNFVFTKVKHSTSGLKLFNYIEIKCISYKTLQPLQSKLISCALKNC